MRRVVVLAAAFGAVNGLLATVLFHLLPITGEVGFVAYGDLPARLELGRPTWWPSIAVLPLTLGGFSALLGALGFKRWQATSKG